MNFSSYVSVCYVILTKLIKHIIQVVAELHLLLASPLCHAAGKTATGELAGVISLLDNFAKQLSPSRAEINKFSEFYILVLKRFEPFLRIPGPSDPRDDSSPLTSILVGRDAISYDLRRIKRIIDGGGKISLKDLQDLRLFHWMLTPAELAVRDEWIADACAQAGKRDKALLDEAATSTDIVLVTDAIGSSSASSSGIVPAIKKLKKGAVAADADGPADMMKFFRAKGKAT